MLNKLNIHKKVSSTSIPYTVINLVWSRQHFYIFLKKKRNWNNWTLNQLWTKVTNQVWTKVTNQ